MSIRSTIASYKIAIGSDQKQPIVILVPVQVDSNVPAELGCLMANVMPGKTLDWRGFLVESHQANAMTIALKGQGQQNPFVVTYRDLLSGFEEHKAHLGRCLPPMKQPEDIIEAAIKAAQLQFGRFYPGSAIDPEDDVLHIVSDTAFAKTGGGTAPHGAKAATPKRVRNDARIRMWI